MFDVLICLVLGVILGAVFRFRRVKWPIAALIIVLFGALAGYLCFLSLPLDFQVMDYMLQLLPEGGQLQIIWNQTHDIRAVAQVAKVLPFLSVLVGVASGLVGYAFVVVVAQIRRHSGKKG